MMKVTQSNPPVKYPNKFKAGDIAIAKRFIRFCDGAEHRRGQEILVTERTVHYYNVCHVDYDKKSVMLCQT